MKKLALALALIALIVIGAAILGHPIYGERFIVDNRPLLVHPLELARMEHPNILITTTGERIAVEGIIFEDGMSNLSGKEVSDRLMNPYPLRLVRDPLSPSKVAFESRIGYFCGNSFRPARFFPKPLLGYEVADLGHRMTMRGMVRVAEVSKSAE